MIIFPEVVDIFEVLNYPTEKIDIKRSRINAIQNLSDLFSFDEDDPKAIFPARSVIIEIGGC
jgi:hypothetical protein